MLLLVIQNISGLPRGFSSLQRMLLTPLFKRTYNFYVDSRKLTNPSWQEFSSTPIQQWSSSTMRLIAENNNLPAQNHYFQATKTVLKIKTLLPELQNLYELLAPGWGLFGFLFSFITLGLFFFYWIGAGQKSSHLHF